MDHERTKQKCCCLVSGRREVPRDIFADNLRLVVNYYAGPHVYHEEYFKRVFVRNKDLLLWIVARGGGSLIVQYTGVDHRLGSPVLGWPQGLGGLAAAQL